MAEVLGQLRAVQQERRQLEQPGRLEQQQVLALERQQQVLALERQLWQSRRHSREQR